MDDLTNWNQFGLTGMVIGALFMTIWAIGKSVVLRLLEMHRAERTEWMDVIKEINHENDLRHKETNAIIRKLTNVIESFNRGRPLRLSIDDEEDG